MILGIDDIVPEALHARVGWDIRHHFMAEKLIDRFGLKLLRDRELIRQLAVVYVLEGRTSTTLADLLTPLLAANPFSTMRASLRR
jgi:hypothetical protein